MVHIPQADPRQHDEHQLDLTDIPHKDPFELFAEWYATAAEQEIADPNAFTLATALFAIIWNNIYTYDAHGLCEMGKAHCS